MNNKLLTSVLAATFLLACNSPGDNNTTISNVETKNTPVINYTLIGVYPHDTTAYTEGLMMHDGKLFESTGYTSELPQTKSLFGTLDLKTGKINPLVQLDTSKYFGEGITFLNDKWYQLTYRSKIGFVYAAHTFKQLQTFKLPVKEGWGMTTDSLNLIISDGTEVLTWMDPGRFTVKKKITVRDNAGPVTLLNELEYIDGFIYANIFTTAFIVKIDATTGDVVGKIDLRNLLTEQKTKFYGTEATNGIAYNPATKRIFITGKMWPNVYELALTK